MINLSVGGKQVTEVERAAIEYAFAKGAVLVAAAGNEGADITNYGLAASDKVLAVASTGFDDQRATFSNWGRISLAAPGLDVLSLRARRTDIMMNVEGAKYKPVLRTSATTSATTVQAAPRSQRRWSAASPH